MELNIKRNKGSYFITGIVLLFVTVGFLYPIINDSQKWLMLFPAVFFLAGSIFCWYRVFDKRPLLLINKDGIYSYRTGITHSWEKIQSAGLYSEDREESTSSGVDRIITKHYFRYYENNGNDGRWRYYSMDDLEVSPEEIREILRYYGH